MKQDLEPETTTAGDADDSAGSGGTARGRSGPSPATAAIQPVRGQDTTSIAGLILLDLAIIGASLAAATVVRGAWFTEPFWTALGLQGKPVYGAWSNVHTALLIFQGLMIPFCLAALKQYRVDPSRGPQWSFERVTLAATGAHLTAIAVLYVLNIQVIPRTVVILDLAAVIVGLSSWRAIWAHRSWQNLREGEGLRNTLFIGADERAQRLASELATSPVATGRRVVGFLSQEGVHDLAWVGSDVVDRSDVWSPDLEAMGGAGKTNGSGGAEDARDLGIPDADSMLAQAVAKNALEQPQHLMAVVGEVDHENLIKAMDGLSAEEIIVSTSLDHATVSGVVRAANERGIEVSLLPEHYPELAKAHEPETLGSFTLLGVHRRPMSQLGWMAKRTLDIVGGLAALVALSPVLALSALAIKLEHPGMSVIYSGTRVGHKGRHFKIHKLATMVPDADDLRDELVEKNAREGPWFQVDPEDDPRITRVGAFLRKYTINEIPQFWNVVKGEMSLVGPRPLATDEVSQFVDHDFRYYRAFDVRPGMTSLWAIRNRSDPSFEKRIEDDFEYIDNWSIWMDLKILLQTPLALFEDEGR